MKIQHKEKPILFSGPMVRAIREGRKTQTRRIVKYQRHPYGHLLGQEGVAKEFLNGTEAIRCPYGQPGDRLWVRETWGNGWTSKPIQGDKLCYRATLLEEQGFKNCYRWRPSIHMPRWASRITLEIVSVRVERLKEISNEDSVYEGIERPSLWKNYRFKTAQPKRGEAITDEEHRIVSYGDPIKSFRSLWESINGPGSWDLNPWVWVVEFKEVKP